MYVNGLGFVDDSSAVAAAATTTVSNTAPVSTSAFDEMLAEETEKYNSTSETKTYDLKSIFEEASEKYGVSYDLLTAIAWHESRFQPDVTSSAGAMGLMQLMPSTASAMGVTDAYDPYENVMGAAKLLGKLSDMYDGNQSLMLAAYSAGTGSVAEYGGIPPYDETLEFVSTVTSILNDGGVTVPEETVTVTTDETGTTTGTSSDTTAYAAYASSYASAAERAYATNQEVYDSFYQTSNIDDVLSYSDYQLLMYYFENMLDIIASIGDTDDTSSSSTDSLFSSSLLSTDSTSTDTVLSSIQTSDSSTLNALDSTLSTSQVLADSLNAAMLTDSNVLNAGAIISATLFNRVNDSDNN